MVSRAVQIIEEKAEAESKPLPLVDGVRTLGKTVVSEGTTDPFAKKADEYNALNGISPVFKANNTKALKKYLRGKDGAESQQIHERKEFLTGYDTFEVVVPPHNLDHLAKLYTLPSASVHYAAVNAKVANIVGLGYKLVETPKTKRALEAAQESGDAKAKKLRRKLDEQREDVIEYLEELNEEDSFTEILTKVWRDYEVTGNGYLEIGRKKTGEIGYIGHIPATTMRIRRSRDGFVQLSGFDAQFFAHYGAGIDENGNPQTVRNPINPGKKTNEVIHFKKYSPTSGYYGVPDIIAAQSAIAGNEFASRYNLDYFENKAVPRYAIILKGATLTPNAESSLLSFFEASLKGQNHRSIYIPLPGDTPEQKVDLELKAIEAGIQDSSFNNYRKANINDVLMAHRVPISKISTGDGGSLAVARDADKTFKEQVCGPEQKVAEKKLAGVIKELADSFILKLNEMTLTDADTQSKIDERGVKNGWKLPNEVRAEQGLSGIPGGNERVDPNAKAKQDAANASANRERDAVRSANATDSAGEARNPKGEGRTTP